MFSQLFKAFLRIQVFRDMEPLCLVVTDVSKARTAVIFKDKGIWSREDTLVPLQMTAVRYFGNVESHSPKDTASWWHGAETYS